MPLCGSLITRNKGEGKEETCLDSADRNQTFACKKCKKCFRKDAAEFEERFAHTHTHTHALTADYIQYIS